MSEHPLQIIYMDFSFLHLIKMLCQVMWLKQYRPGLCLEEGEEQEERQLLGDKHNGDVQRC